MALGLVSALLGAIMALAQDDLKRLLAYDTISQMGVLVVGFATGDPRRASPAPRTTWSTTRCSRRCCSCARARSCTAPAVTRLSEMGGLARRCRWITAAFMLGAVSIAGIPPLNGYVSLSLIHQRPEQDHEPRRLRAHAGRAGDHGRRAGPRRVAGLLPAPGGRRTSGSEQLRPGMLTGLVSLGVCCIAFGGSGPALLRTADGAGRGGLLHPGRYAAAVLAGAGWCRTAVPFDYGSPAELASVAAISVVIGRPGLGIPAHPGAAPVRLLRARTPARPTTTRPTLSPGRLS